MHRHQPDPGVLGARLLVHLGEQRQPIDEAAERRLRVPRLVVARRGDEFHQVLGPLVGLFGVLVPQILKVAGSIEHLADGDRDRVGPRVVGQAHDEIAEGPQRGDGTVAQPRLVDGVDQPPPE